MKKLSFLLFVVFVSFFILAWCTKKTDIQENTNEINQGSNEYKEVVSTLEKLYKDWGEKTCEFALNQDWMNIEWTIYIDWKTMKTESKTNLNWIVIQGSVLTKDGYTYTRDDEQAWKIKDDEDDYEEYEEAYEDDDNLDNTNITFKCKDSISDKSVLEIPNNIEFKEFNDMAGFEYLDDLEDTSY